MNITLMGQPDNNSFKFVYIIIKQSFKMKDIKNITRLIDEISYLKNRSILLDEITIIQPR